MFGRFENIDKSGHELVLPEAFHTQKFNINAVTIGYVHDITHGAGMDTGVGAAVTVNTRPSALDAFYGSGTPISFQVFLRLRPSRMGAHAYGMGMGQAGHSMQGMSDQAGVRIAATMTPDPPKARQKNTLKITLTDAQSKPITGAQVKAAVEMTSMDMGVEHPAFKEAGNGQYQGDVSFAMAGPWRATLTITLPGRKTPLTKSIDYMVAE